MIRVAVPPTRMERVEGTPTSAVPFISRVELPSSVHATDLLPANPLTFGAALIEALASSRIEGIRPSVTQVALAYFQPRHPDVTPAGRTVTACLRAMLAETVTYRDHRAAHDRLMRGQGTPAFAGGFRQSIVRISDHVAPAPRRVTELMEDLAVFTETRPATVLTAAIAHAQFESIHPYPDGNGRIGRALLSAQLRVPISRHFARHRQAYYDALRDYRLGDATPIVELTGAAAVDGFELIEETFESGPVPADLSVAERRAAERATRRPVGTRTGMLQGSSGILHDGFAQLQERALIVEARGTSAGRSEPGASARDKSPGSTGPVYVYLPVIRDWISLANTDLYATHSETSWKRDLHVHL